MHKKVKKICIYEKKVVSLQSEIENGADKRFHSLVNNSPIPE